MIERIEESVHIAVSNLMINTVRSLLSVIGIVIGIAAVIVVLAVATGARRGILERLNMMGGNVYTVSASFDEKSMRVGTLTLEDVERLSRLSFVESVVPNLNLYLTIRSRWGEDRAVIRGADSAFFKMRGYAIAEGRAFSPLEVEQRAFVCVVGNRIASRLFPERPAIGEYLYIDGTPWKVIGLYGMPVRSQQAGRREGALEVVVPLDTLIRNVKDVRLQYLEVQTKPGGSTEPVRELQEAIEKNDPNRKGLFAVRDQQGMVAQSLEIQKSLMWIGALVAGVSLVVGGIGMMNVMLTSVAERNREIGLRRAVGARKKDVLMQFLIESCVLSAVGGGTGLLLGAAIARSFPIFLKQMTFTPEIPPSFIVLALGAGMVLGILFGLYPAVKASNLSPAESLRSE